MNEERVQELIAQGYNCAQIMVIMGMEQQGKNDPDLVRAATGLGGGLGGCGKNCGALTGAVSALGLFAGRSLEENAPKSDMMPMVQELVNWFEEINGTVNCEEILEGNPENKRLRCPGIIMDTCDKLFEILDDYGYILD